MKLEVNITKKRFFALFGAFLLLAGVGLVYATSHPGFVGHTPDQIDWSQPIPGDSGISGDLIVDGKIGVGTGTTTPRGKLEIKVPNVDASTGYPSIIFDIDTSDTNNAVDYLIKTKGYGGQTDVTHLIENWGGKYRWQRGSASGPVEVMTLDTGAGRLRVSHSSGAYIEWRTVEINAHSYGGWGGEEGCNAGTDTCNGNGDDGYTCGNLEKRTCTDWDRQSSTTTCWQGHYESRTVTCRTQFEFQPNSVKSDYILS